MFWRNVENVVINWKYKNIYTVTKIFSFCVVSRIYFVIPKQIRGYGRTRFKRWQSGDDGADYFTSGCSGETRIA